tara:strand:+ start:63 stop:602 length:540 start_codon:yes stop_codon:yes gene_type:complete
MGSEDSLDERHAYNRILRGITALIVFSAIALVPHMISLVNITTTQYDDSKFDGDLDDIPSSCILGENYDPEKCFDALKSVAIIESLFQIIIFSIPIYGFIEVYRGVSRISELRTTKGFNLTESTKPPEIKDEEIENEDINIDGDEEDSENSKPTISRTLIEFTVIIILAIGSWYLVLSR